VVYSITLILLCAWIARFDCEQLGSQVKFLGPWACNVPFFFFKEKKKKNSFMDECVVLLTLSSSALRSIGAIVLATFYFIF
jgi:hypothetical protein